MIYGSEEFWEVFEERAAIMEFDGCLSRKEAEREAFKDMAGQCKKCKI